MQQHLHQTLDPGLTVWIASRLAHYQNRTGKRFAATQTEQDVLEDVTHAHIGRAWLAHYELWKITGS